LRRFTKVAAAARKATAGGKRALTQQRGGALKPRDVNVYVDDNVDVLSPTKVGRCKLKPIPQLFHNPTTVPATVPATFPATVPATLPATVSQS
jgi:hypothetical protein